MTAIALSVLGMLLGGACCWVLMLAREALLEARDAASTAAATAQAHKAVEQELQEHRERIYALERDMDTAARAAKFQRMRET